jgi:hypothetical protein
MIEEDFYCTLKLKSGEEVFAKVAASEEEERTFLIVSNPIVISEYKSRGGESGYKIEPWLKTTTEDMFIIKLDDVLTLSESYDIEMISMYQSYLRKSYKKKNNESNINRQMGYLSSVNDAKDILEKLYESS